MPPPVPAQPGLNLSIGDIYYLLFRHKWKILLSTIVGLGGAAVFYKTQEAPFRSVAKLFVRFVITEGKSISPTDDTTAKSPDQRGETIMTGEREIITSGDLARRVAERVGPERILAKAGGGTDLQTATAQVRSGLSVTVPARSSVMHVSFQHPDFQVVQPVLREVIDQYLQLHVETHRSVGVLGDLLIQETDQLRARLAQTEEELRKALNQAGVVTLQDAKSGYAVQVSELRQQIFKAEAELAERTAAIQEINRRLPALAEPETRTQASALAGKEAPPPEAVTKYQAVLSLLAQLRGMEQSLLLQFTAENVRVKEVRSQITEADSIRQALEAETPALARITQPAPPVPTDTSSPAYDLTSQYAAVAATQAKIKVLNGQMETIRAESTKLDQLEGAILELERKRRLEEENYIEFAASLERARINETLGSGRVSNIGVIQSPSVPFVDRSRILKLTAGIAGAGLVFGLLCAVAIEFFLDRTLRKPSEIEPRLNLPLFLTIPRLSRAKKRRFRWKRKKGAGEAGSTPEQLSPALRELAALDKGSIFHETLRDRMISFFESRNLTHKPKLVALTSLTPNAGVTTTAAGLARSLSETGEGNVLLVDMTAGQGSSQQFIKGQPVCDLDSLLDARDSAHVQENLYVVRESKNSEQLSRNLPQRFSRLIPKLKASDFDYIIFDMPVVSQISITPRLANFMDMVLLVVESEKSDRDLVRRAADLLAQSRAFVGVVLNKTRFYVPRKLHQEFLAAP